MVFSTRLLMLPFIRPNRLHLFDKLGPENKNFKSPPDSGHGSTHLWTQLSGKAGAKAVTSKSPCTIVTALATLWGLLFPHTVSSPTLFHPLTRGRRGTRIEGRGIISSLTTTTNKLQPSSLNDHQPLTPPLGVPAFMCPLKSSQNPKRHTTVETICRLDNHRAWGKSQLLQTVPHLGLNKSTCLQCFCGFCKTPKFQDPLSVSNVNASFMWTSV